MAMYPILMASASRLTWSGDWPAFVSGRQLFVFFFLLVCVPPFSMASGSTGPTTFSSPSWFRSAAIEPTRVFMPVATTTPTQVPAFTLHEEKAMLSAVSFSGWPEMGCLTTVFFATSSGSPVRSISFTRKSLVWMLRMSAGTTSPVLSFTMSPGTMSRELTSTSWPSRMTTEMGDCKEESASRASLALFSVTAAMVALMRTMIEMAIESMYERTLPRSGPVALITADATTAAISRYMITEFSWMMKSTSSDTRGGFSSSLGP
jgi:hypothetical protein